MPAPDSLERWAAAQQQQQEKTTTTTAPPLGPQFSFVRAPKLRNGQQQQGTPGVALGGSGSGGGSNGGAASKARAAFVGLGDPLPPGLAKRWKDPSVPIDIDTEEVRVEEREREVWGEVEGRRRRRRKKKTHPERGKNWGK